jgi:ATP/maltotriose-dependent transcriptional regulator MalT
MAVYEEVGDPPKRFDALADLAETQLQVGKIEKAEGTALKVLRRMEATHADYNEAVALWTLAGVRMVRGDLADADSLLARSAEVVRERFSPRHPFCAELPFRRAQLRRLQGRDAQAEEDFRCAIALMSDIGGQNHPRIAQMHEEWEERPQKPRESEFGR